MFTRFAVTFERMLTFVFPQPRCAAFMVMPMQAKNCPLIIIRKYATESAMYSACAPARRIIGSVKKQDMATIIAPSIRFIQSDCFSVLDAPIMSPSPRRLATTAVTPILSDNIAVIISIRGCPVTPTADMALGPSELTIMVSTLDTSATSTLSIALGHAIERHLPYACLAEGSSPFTSEGATMFFGVNNLSITPAISLFHLYGVPGFVIYAYKIAKVMEHRAAIQHLFGRVICFAAGKVFVQPVHGGLIGRGIIDIFRVARGDCAVV